MIVPWGFLWSFLLSLLYQRQSRQPQGRGVGATKDGFLWGPPIAICHRKSSSVVILQPSLSRSLLHLRTTRLLQQYSLCNFLLLMLRWLSNSCRALDRYYLPMFVYVKGGMQNDLEDAVSRESDCFLSLFVTQTQCTLSITYLLEMPSVTSCGCLWTLPSIFSYGVLLVACWYCVPIRIVLQ